MPSPYQAFVQKAKERFTKRQQLPSSTTGRYQYTLHARYKMRQYGLSEQRVRSVLRFPKRREEGVVPKTIAVMQPVSPKILAGKETWKQEIWVMFQIRGEGQRLKKGEQKNERLFTPQHLRIVSAWRYPGVSPKRNPIPEEILRELEEGSILEAKNENYF